MFHHCDAYWLGVIIEVSCSQKRKAVPHLADDYILETDGSVHVVIGLRLELKDFAPEDLTKGISGSFLINSTILCQFLNEAEQREQNTKEKRGLVEYLLPGIKKRRREETLLEEVSSDDDHKLVDDERRVRTRDSEDDSSYKLSQ